MNILDLSLLAEKFCSPAQLKLVDEVFNVLNEKYKHLVPKEFDLPGVTTVVYLASMASTCSVTSDETFNDYLPNYDNIVKDLYLQFFDKLSDFEKFAIYSQMLIDEGYEVDFDQELYPNSIPYFLDTFRGIASDDSYNEQFGQYGLPACANKVRKRLFK